MVKDGALHEALIPILVSALCCESYLEFGSGDNLTMAKVNCPKKVGVDPAGKDIEGAHIFKMPVEEFIRLHASAYGPYDFVFIDADHACASVLKDFFSIYHHVSPDGLIVLHDTNPETLAETHHQLCGDAWRAACELYGMGCEGVTLPFNPGLTILRKRSRWGPAA